MKNRYFNRITASFLGVGFSLAVTNCSTSPSHPKLYTKVWDTSETCSKTEFRFPEKDLNSLKMKKNLGLCFSGGGTVSATATTGQLRALHAMGHLKDVRYISAASGGSWGALPFIFHNAGDKKISVEQLLGSFREPQFLRKEDFPEQKPSHLLGVPDLPENISFASRLNANAFITKRMLSGIGNGDENFARALGEIYLEPLGLNNPKRYFTHDEQTFDHARSVNPQFEKKDFYIANGGHSTKPFFIANAYLVKRHQRDAMKRLYHLELTPFYSGVRRLDMTSHKSPIGGGYIETFAMDTRPIRPQIHKYRKVGYHADFYGGVQNEFALSDLLAATGAAPTVPKSLSYLSDVFGFPEFRHWSAGTEQSEAKEYLTTDGGTIDNLGIHSLLAREVETIFVFLNNETSFISRDKDGNLKIPLVISSLFGKGDRDALSFRSQWKNSANEVFQKSDFEKLVRGFEERLVKCEPLVVKSKLRTVRNDAHKVPAGINVDVIWFVMAGWNERKTRSLARSGDGLNPWTNETKWWKLLAPDVRTKLEGFKLKTFPFFPTFLATQNNVIALGVEKTEPLAHYASYQVWQSRGIVDRAFQDARRAP